MTNPASATAAASATPTVRWRFLFADDAVSAQDSIVAVWAALEECGSGPICCGGGGGGAGA